MQETQVWSLGWEDPLEKGMATHSSILVWRIPWTEEPGGLQSMELQRAGHNWAANAFTFFFHFLCVLPGPFFSCVSRDPIGLASILSFSNLPMQMYSELHLHYFPYPLLFYVITGTPPVGWNHCPGVKEETWHEDTVHVEVCLFSCQGTDWLHVLFCRFLSGTWGPFHSLAALIDKHQPWNLQPTYFW